MKTVEKVPTRRLHSQGNRSAPKLDGIDERKNARLRPSSAISSKQIKVVKIAMRQLRWSEDEYQLVLEKIGVPIGTSGRRSCKRMTQRQFDEYVRHASECGFDATCGAIPPTDRPSRAQMFRLHQLEQEVLAVIPGGMDYVKGVIAQATAGKPLEWWGPEQAANAIDALERVKARMK